MFCESIFDSADIMNCKVKQFHLWSVMDDFVRRLYREMLALMCFLAAVETHHR